jgi:hypothetical protein
MSVPVSESHGASPVVKERSTGMGVRMMFDQIRHAGCYVCEWSGHLLRVSEAAAARGLATLPSVMGPDPLFVTKISDEPELPLDEAKSIARSLELSINF